MKMNKMKYYILSSVLLISSTTYAGYFDFLDKMFTNYDNTQASQAVDSVSGTDDSGSIDSAAVDSVENVSVKSIGLNKKTTNAVKVAEQADIDSDFAVDQAVAKIKEAAQYADKLADVAKQFALSAADEADKKNELAKAAKDTEKFVSGLAKKAAIETAKTVNNASIQLDKKYLKDMTVEQLYTELNDASNQASSFSQATEEANQAAVAAIKNAQQQAEKSAEVAKRSAMIAQEIAVRAKQKAELAKTYAKQQLTNAKKIEQTAETIKKSNMKVSRDKNVPTASKVNNKVNPNG